MARILLNNINKMYDKNNYAVSDFNIEIDEEEFIVFVGPSGCGKSTTLRMIAGLEEITSGDLYIDETRMNDVAPKDRDIAMVFQNYALYPHMNVYENMAFGLKLRKIKKEEINRRVNEAAKILGLESLLKRKPKALSGGQRQRVALGRAIVRDPKVFLMDEPLSNLDAKLRVQMRSEIQKLHRRLKTTTIYVTHDQTEAMTMATRLVVMKDGYIQQIGTPKEVYSFPNNQFVASFIGSPQMSFIEGKIVDEDFQIGNLAKLKVPDDKRAMLKSQGYNDVEVILGIRPEDIYSSSENLKGQFQSKITLTVEVAELMGSETFLYFNFNGHSITARVDAKVDVKSGEDIELMLDMDKVHFFDKDTGIRIH